MKERDRERDCMGDRLANGNEMANFFETPCVAFHLHHSIRVNKFPLMKAKAETLGKHFFFWSLSVLTHYHFNVKLTRVKERERERERETERDREREGKRETGG